MKFNIRLSEFTRNTITISKGTILSQAIIIVATPILTRLYAPESFGKLALFASGYSILVGLFSARYELSIVLPKEDSVAMKLMSLTLALSLTASTGLLALMILAKLLRIVPVAGYWLLLPAAIFAGTAYSVMQNWFSRKKRFDLSARSGVMNSAANALFCFLLFYLIPRGEDQLVYSYLIGFIVAALYLSRRFFKQKPGSWIAGKRDMIALAGEYHHFPRYMVPTSLLGILSYQLIPFLLKQFYSLEDVGFYSIANRFLFLPSILLGAAIAEVFRVDLAAKANEGIDLGPLFKSTLKKMLVIGGPAFLALLAFAPFAFRLILGRGYMNAGIYARYLCVAVFGQFLMQPFGYVYIIKNKIKVYFVFQLALALTSILAIVGGSLMVGGIKSSLLLLSASTIAVSGASLYVAYRVIEAPGS
jgi:O-antigen/teichoic acid export membrane protein